MATEPEEIELEIEETAKKLDQTGTEFSNAIKVEMAADETAMEEMDTEWSSDSSTLKVGGTETTEMINKVVSNIGDKILPKEELTQSFEKNVLDDVFGPDVKGMELKNVTTLLGQASGEVSFLETETKGAELATKSPKYSKLKLMGKIAMYGAGVIMGLDWVASKLAAIVEVSMHSDDTPAWTKNMTKELKEELTHVSGALPKLGILVKSWMKQWEQYKDANVDFGKITVTVNSTTHDVPVMYMLFYAFTDMNEVVKNTQEILAPGISDLTIADVIVAANNIFVVLADALSIFDLRDHSKALKTLNFPPIDDKATVENIIITFKDGRKKVAAVGVKYTRFAATNTIKTYLQVKVTEKIYQGLQDVVLPAMQAAAKQAYKDAAQSHMDDEKAAIRALAWVPGAGIELAQEKLQSEQKEAAKLGTEAAQKAAEKKLRELRPQVESTAKLEVQKYASVDQAQLKAIANLAIDSAMGQVKKAVSSSK